MSKQNNQQASNKLIGSKKRITLTIARASVMTALVFVATFTVQVYIPATRGYLNFGDIMIFVSALTFGPTVGGFAGGVGAALSDAVSGFGYYAPFTLIIKGLEGVIAGSISNRKQIWRDIIAVIVASTVMVIGYFLAEFFPLQIGLAALIEIPGNIMQVAIGALVGVPISLVMRKRLPEQWWK